MTERQKKNKISKLEKENKLLTRHINEYCFQIRKWRKQVSENEKEMERLENEILFD